MNTSFSLSRKIELQCTAAHAFRIFTKKIDLWWPKGHRRDGHAELVMEPMSGGRLFERSTDGAEWTIGEIVDCTPPSSLSFNWFPGSPDAPTLVEVRFEGLGESATICIEHRAVSSQAGEIWPQRVALFEKGWDTILPAFKAYCAPSS